MSHGMLIIAIFSIYIYIFIKVTYISRSPHSPGGVEVNRTAQKGPKLRLYGISLSVESFKRFV